MQRSLGLTLQSGATQALCTDIALFRSAVVEGGDAVAMNEQLVRKAEVKVLIAHCDPILSAGLAAVLRAQTGFRVDALGIENNLSVLTAAQSLEPDVVIADYDSAVQLIQSGYTRGDRILILTDADSEAKVWYALKQGTRGYLLQGCSLEELLRGVNSVSRGEFTVAPLVARRITERMNQEALTKKEELVLRHLIRGLTNKKIAIALQVTEGTVKTHVKSILKKLGAESRTAAVTIAQSRGIL